MSSKRRKCCFRDPKIQNFSRGSMQPDPLEMCHHNSLTGSENSFTSCTHNCGEPWEDQNTRTKIRWSIIGVPGSSLCAFVRRIEMPGYEAVEVGKLVEFRHHICFQIWRHWMLASIIATKFLYFPALWTISIKEHTSTAITSWVVIVIKTTLLPNMAQ